MVAKMKKKHLNEAFIWGESHRFVIQKCNNSVITATNGHHGSGGRYFSFGHNAMYKTDNMSSVG